jgi:hypothetical protein
MKNTKQSNFYVFEQNNSGVFFDVNENVSHLVVIEAYTSEDAISIFEPMIENQSCSCSCCGDRWSTYSPDKIELSKWEKDGYSVGVDERYEDEDAEQEWLKLYGEFGRIEEPVWKKSYSSKEFVGKVYFKTIEEYCQFMANSWGCESPDIIIHYLDGTKKEIFKLEIQ